MVANKRFSILFYTFIRSLVLATTKDYPTLSVKWFLKLLAGSVRLTTRFFGANSHPPVLTYVCSDL
jgi:hypothetical protein